MAKIERRYDNGGQLTWAKGLVRDIYKDKTILNSCAVSFRIAGENRLYNIIIPRHCAGTIIGKLPTEENLEDVISKLPPFEKWRFVMVGYGKSGQIEFEIAREVSGEALIEVDIEAV
jgi:hypothetical protein